MPPKTKSLNKSKYKRLKLLALNSLPKSIVSEIRNEPIPEKTNKPAIYRIDSHNFLKSVRIT